MGLQRLVFCHPAGVTYLIALPSPSGLETHYQASRSMPAYGTTLTMVSLVQGEPAIKLFASVRQLVNQLKLPPVEDKGLPDIDERIDVDIVDWLTSNGESLELAQD